MARTWPYARNDHFERELRATAARYFASKGLAVHPRYPFILADWNDWPTNVILPEVADYVHEERARREAVAQGFPLHKYVHHGLSSQAMLFNLIGPMIVRQDFSPLKTALAAAGVPLPDGEVEGILEAEDRTVFNEDAGQPTSFDLLIRPTDGDTPIFIESKFVEKEFGGCSVFAKGNCEGMNPADNHERCFLHYIGRRYWTLMAANGLLNGPLGRNPFCPLACHYQFFRELLFAVQQGGHFVLLHDKRNPAFYCDGPQGERGLYPFLTSLLPESLRSKVGRITVQQIFAAVSSSDRHADWAPEFALKYALDSH